MAFSYPERVNRKVPGLKLSNVEGRQLKHFQHKVKTLTVMVYPGTEDPQKTSLGAPSALALRMFPCISDCV